MKRLIDKAAKEGQIGMDAMLLVKASLLLSATLLAARLLRRAPAASRHRLWTLAFAAVLALPLLVVAAAGRPRAGAGPLRGAGDLRRRPPTDQIDRIGRRRPGPIHSTTIVRDSDPLRSGIAARPGSRNEANRQWRRMRPA